MTVYKYLVSDYNSHKIVTCVGIFEALLFLLGYCLKEGLESTMQQHFVSGNHVPLPTPVPAPTSVSIAIDDLSASFVTGTTTIKERDFNISEDEFEQNLCDRGSEQFEQNTGRKQLQDYNSQRERDQQHSNRLHQYQLRQQYQHQHYNESQFDQQLDQQPQQQDKQDLVLIQQPEQHNEQDQQQEQRKEVEHHNNKQKPKKQQISTKLLRLLQSICLFAICIRIAAPILQTLTSSFSEDTIHALAIAFSLLHLLLYDYSYICRPTNSAGSGSFAGSLSLNAAMFTAVLLASRLSNMEKVVVFILLAILSFSLYQPVAKIVYLRSRALFLAITIVLAVLASFLLWFLDKTLFTAFLVLLFFTWIVSPLALVHTTNLKRATMN